MIALAEQGCSRGRIYYTRAAVLAIAAVDGMPAKADMITVVLDRQGDQDLPPTTTVVVGVAHRHIAVQAGGMMVVTGKGYGVTASALDTRIGTSWINRRGARPSEHIVVVHRGIEQKSYSCTPMRAAHHAGRSAVFFDATRTNGRRMARLRYGRCQVADGSTNGAPRVCLRLKAINTKQAGVGHRLE